MCGVSDDLMDGLMRREIMRHGVIRGQLMGHGNNQVAVNETWQCEEFRRDIM